MQDGVATIGASVKSSLALGAALLCAAVQAASVQAADLNSASPVAAQATDLASAAAPVSAQATDLASAAAPVAAQATDLASAAAPVAAQATDLGAAAAQSAAAMPNYSWSSYFMGLSLMFIMLAMFWYGARFIKRSGSLRFFGMTPTLNIESRLSLGPRKHLMVVRYRDKRLLLGVSDHNINLLSEEKLEADELAEQQEGTEATAQYAPTGISGKFKDIFNEISKRK